MSRGVLTPQCAVCPPGLSISSHALRFTCCHALPLPLSLSLCPHPSEPRLSCPTQLVVVRVQCFPSLVWRQRLCLALRPAPPPSPASLLHPGRMLSTGLPRPLACVARLLLTLPIVPVSCSVLPNVWRPRPWPSVHHTSLTVWLCLHFHSPACLPVPTPHPGTAVAVVA
jgi:hypothetical protein